MGVSRHAFDETSPHLRGLRKDPLFTSKTPCMVKILVIERILPEVHDDPARSDPFLAVSIAVKLGQAAMPCVLCHCQMQAR